MIRRHVLSALAAGIAAGDDDAARAALRSIDWVLRRPARRRLERALFDAALAIDEVDPGDPDDVRHVQRVAALTVAGRRRSANDRDRVAVAYAALERDVAPPPRRWVATFAAAVIALITLGGVGHAAWTHWPRAGRRFYARPLPPPAAGAFRDGGQPLTDPAVAALLAVELTRLVVETDADRRTGDAIPERLARSAALMEPAAITSHGPALAAAWRAMVTMLDRWRRMPAGDPMFRTMSIAVTETVRGVSDQLAAAGLGYYLESNVMFSSDVAHAIVHAYRVEEVVFVSVAGKPRRVLSLRRLDQLNVVHDVLGMESAQLGDPVLMLDQIDAHVTARTLPVLAPGLPYPLGDPSWAALSEAGPVAAAAGEAVRRELARCLGDDAADAAEIAALLAERAAILARWRSELAQRHIRFVDTDALFLPDDLAAQLDGLVPSSQRRRVADIEDELARLDAPRIAVRLHELVANSVRRHEVQHGVDHERGRVPAAPADPAARSDGDGAADAGAGSPPYPAAARGELSAYTSQIANDPVTPQLAYWNVARFAFDRQMWGTAESYAGAVITAGIARHLKLAAEAPLIHDGEIDRRRLGAIAAAIAAQPGDALRAAARATWQDLFGEPLEAIVDGLPRDPAQRAAR